MMSNWHRLSTQNHKPYRSGCWQNKKPHGNRPRKKNEPYKNRLRQKKNEPQNRQRYRHGCLNERLGHECRHSLSGILLSSLAHMIFPALWISKIQRIRNLYRVLCRHGHLSGNLKCRRSTLKYFPFFIDSHISALWKSKIQRIRNL